MKKSLSALLILASLFATSGIAWANFPDVPQDHYNYWAIKYVEDQGIVNGHDDGFYRPDDPIDRAAFTKIIVESQFTQQEIDSCGSADFFDIPEGIWYDKYACVAQKNNVLDGYEDGSFGGEKLINLAEASKIIVNGFGYPVQEDPIWYKPYILVLEQNGALPYTLTGFDHQLTRGEMAEIIYRLLLGFKYKNSAAYDYLDKTLSLTQEQVDELLLQDQALDHQWILTFRKNQAVEIYSNYLKFFDTNKDATNIDVIDFERSKAITNIQTIKEDILTIDPHENDSTLIGAVLNEIDVIISLLNEEFKQANDIYADVTKNEADLTEEEILISTSEINTLFASAGDKFSSAEEVFTKAYFEFGKNHGLQVFYGSAPGYGNSLLNLYTNVLDAHTSYTSDFIELTEAADFDTLETRRQQTLLELESIKLQAQNQGEYLYDSSLMDATVEAIDLFIDLLSQEEAQLIELQRKFSETPEEFTDADFETQVQLSNAIEQKINQADAALQSAYVDFATRYDITDPAN